MNHKKNNAETLSIKYVVHILKVFFRIAGRFRPSFYMIYFAYIVVNGIAPFINIIFPKYIIDELLGSRDVKRLILYTVLTVGLNTVLNMLKDIINETKNKCKDALDPYFARLISEKAITMDFEHTENPKVLDQMEKAKNAMDWYSGGVCGLADAFCSIIMNIITLLGVGVLLVMGMPWLIVIYAISLVLDRYFTKKVNQIDMKSFKEMAKRNRVFGYLFWTLQEIRFGKDIRLYGAEKMMEDKAASYNKDIIEIWRKQSEAQLGYDEGSGIVSTLRSLLTILLIGYKTLIGEMTLGDFSMYYNAGESLHGSLKSLIFNIQELYKKVCYAKEFIVFMEYPDATVHGKESVPISEAYTVEFKHVSFAYPRSEEKVLKDINMILHPGEHISIVGPNGAGKTTFIKLLCRLYDPTEGEILLNGVNIKNFAYDEYVKLLSVVFQDFQLFAFPAKENITLGQVKSKDAENKKNLDIIIEEAGLKTTLSRLPKGKDTYIFKGYEEDGIELSGGQQQKLAIARALYKDASIIILDEPTAALDPIAEYDIYRQFNHLIGNKTAIYISHRLSSCQFCDIIYVFEEGKIKEIGKHEELVTLKDGTYAGMFEAQAQYYR